MTINTINNTTINTIVNALCGTDVELSPIHGQHIQETGDLYPINHQGESDCTDRCKDEDTYARADIGITSIVEDDVWLYNKGLSRDLLVQEENVEKALWAARDARYRLDLWKESLDELQWKVSYKEKYRFHKEAKRVKGLFDAVNYQIATIDYSFGELEDSSGSSREPSKGYDLMTEIKYYTLNGTYSEGYCAFLLDTLGDMYNQFSHENYLIVKGILLRRLSNGEQSHYHCFSSTGYCFTKEVGWTNELNQLKETFKAYKEKLKEQENEISLAPEIGESIYGDMTIGSIESLIDLKTAAMNIHMRHNISLEEACDMLSED
jgi:hypothetical protein